jgi:hypothetical protein
MAKLFVHLLADGKLVKKTPANNSIVAELLYGDSGCHEKVVVAFEFKKYSSSDKQVELSINGKRYHSYDFKL